jgi:hypothetical protein
MLGDFIDLVGELRVAQREAGSRHETTIAGF